MARRYIQLSGMTFGGMIEADRRTRALELRQRWDRRRKIDKATWNNWEGLVEEEKRLEKLQKERRGSDG